MSDDRLLVLSEAMLDECHFKHQNCHNTFTYNKTLLYISIIIIIVYIYIYINATKLTIV